MSINCANPWNSAIPPFTYITLLMAIFFQEKKSDAEKIDLDPLTPSLTILNTKFSIPFNIKKGKNQNILKIQGVINCEKV